ncbi:Alpha/Beta hydrolase protein [Amanita rubescens]|nr:Alpha/Beta hydrolase protein [Amanita rubescens]
MRLGSFGLLLSLFSLVYAVPSLIPRTETTVSVSQFAGLAPYTQFARAVYCPTSKLSGWSCGQACAALSGFQPTLVGGNGDSIPIFFVGYWPEQSSVVVAHEGTDPTKLLSLLTDADFIMIPLDPTLFPGVSSSALAHQGFLDAQAETAPQILAEVRSLLSQHNTNSLTLVGHSLGGAIAEIDSLFFALNIPGVSIKTVTYGTPRVGNLDFAQLIDSHVPNFSRVNNMLDVIPIVPGRFLGFSHPDGEIHILSTSGNAVACSGNDDATDPNCTDKSVPNIFEGNILDHLGPYDGIFIGTIYCT